MSHAILWFSVLVILSNVVLKNVEGQSAQSRDSSTVFLALETLSKAVERLEAKIELQTTSMSDIEANVKMQANSLSSMEASLNNLETTAATTASLFNSIETKVDEQATTLSDLKALIEKLETSEEIQATALKDLMTKEPWQETIAQSPTNGTILALEGDDVEMWCVVHGTPLPEINWTRENEAMVSDRVAIENNGKTLRIKNVQLNDEGSYVCVAANGVGTPATRSVSLEVYRKYRQCHKMIESDKGNLEIEPSNSSCLSVIKLENTTGFRLELDPLMTESILVIPELNSSNSNGQSIWINGSKNVSTYEFEGEKLAIVVPPRRERMSLNWRGLAAISEIKSTTKFVNDSEGTLEWEPMRDGSGKIFWEFSHEMPVKLNWTLNTNFTAEDKENPCENMFFSVLKIQPDGNINEVQKACDGSSKGSVMLEIRSEVLILLQIQSAEAASAKLQISWTNYDEPLRGIIAGTHGGIYVVPQNFGQTKAVTSGLIFGLTFDWNSQKIYYLKRDVGIMRSNLDGSESEILVSDSSSIPFGMTIEQTSGNLYYGSRSQNFIRVCNNNANKCSTIANSSDLSRVYGIAVHQSKGLLFWSIEGQKLIRANLDGSNATIVLERRVWGIDVDEQEDRLYWGGPEGIGSCDLNGQENRMLANVNTHTSDVTVNNDTIYYATWETKTIHVISKSGTNKRLVAQLTNNILHIPLFGTQVSNQPANPCKKSNCAHLCVLVTRWTYRCTCPDAKVLNPDGKTCNA